MGNADCSGGGRPRGTGMSPFGWGSIRSAGTASAVRGLHLIQVFFAQTIRTGKMNGQAQVRGIVGTG